MFRASFALVIFVFSADLEAIAKPVSAQLLAKITASDGEAGAYFGQAVALQGNTALIGAPDLDPHSDSVGSGAAYLYDLATAPFTETKLAPSDGEAADRFGYAVAIDCDTPVVRAPHRPDTMASSGAAEPNTVRTLPVIEAALSPDETADDAPGPMAGVTACAALVGAPATLNGGACRHTADGNPDFGSAYLFDLRGPRPVEIKLPFGDGACGDDFGISVAIDDGIALVGAPSWYGTRTRSPASGVAYLYRPDGDGLAEIKLTHPDPDPEDHLGLTVALDGGTALIGSGEDYPAPNDRRAGLYSFDIHAPRPAGTALAQPEGSSRDYYRPVAIDLYDNTAIVAVWGEDNRKKEISQAFLFDIDRSKSSGIRLDGHGNLRNKPFYSLSFNVGAAISGKFAIIGNGRAGGVDRKQTGAAFIFNHDNRVALLRFFAPDGKGQDHFGHSVAISGDLVLVGAPNADIDGREDQGAAYLFRITEEPAR